MSPSNGYISKWRLLSGVAVVAALLCIALGGCLTEQERRGYSDLPQNRPATWETKPYGESRL